MVERMSAEGSAYYQSVLNKDIPLIFPEHPPTKEELLNNGMWKEYKESRGLPDEITVWQRIDRLEK